MAKKPHFVRCGPYIKPRKWRDLPTSELTRAERNMRFAERYLMIPEGRMVGKPIRLVQFQEEFFYSVFDNPAGTRRAFLVMARKNGKTALIAIILLCFLIGPESVQNSQIVSGALSRDQAALVWNLANKMLMLNPELENLVHVIPSGKKLIGRARTVEYKALSAEGKTNHGLSPICGILDEMGQVRGPFDPFIEAVETSQGAYEEPLLLIISTQAPTNSDWLSIQLDDAENSQDPRIVAHVYAAPEDCELDDEKAWAMANPALGLFLNKNELIDGANKAIRMPSFSNSFRNLHLNQRVDVEVPFVSRSTWEANGQAGESLKGQKVYGGLDLSAVSDLTGLVLVGEEGDVEVQAWLPKEGIVEKSRSDRVPYDVWAKEGLLNLTPGKSIQYEYVARELKRIFDEYDVQQINFDRYNMKFLRPWLEHAGFTEKQMEKFTDFGQGYVSMSPALRSLETSLLSEELKHGMNPLLTMCMGNCVVEIDAAGNRKFTKKKSTGRIDLAVCLAMAEDARFAHKEKSNEGEWSLHFV